MESNSEVQISTPRLCPLVSSGYTIHLAQDEPAEFQINGETVQVPIHDGLFINADQIVNEHNRTLCVKIFPKSDLDRNHWRSKIVDRLQEKKIQPYFELHNDIPSEKAVLDGLKILASIQSEDPGSYPFLAPGIVYSMMQTVANRVEATCTLEFPPDDQVRCRDLMKYFAAHYPERLNLPDIADIFDVTPNTCIKTFRKYIGITPIDYLNLYRMNEACKLLTTTRIKISDIATRVGIQDNSYFTASFKKLLGMTPSQYRKRNTPQTD